MNNLIIVGTSTNARHVYEFVKFYNLYNIVGFAVNKEYKNSNTFLDLPVYTLENIEEEYGSSNFELFIAILWNRLNKDRRLIYEFCKSKGYKMANIISPTAIIRSEIKGDNCWIHDYVIIQNNAEIAENNSIMAYTLIGANTKVGPHCFFGARSLLGGGSSIGEQSFVGINSTIFDCTQIGKKCIIGACTAVKRNMPDFSKYSTSSDNITIKEYSEEEIEDKLLFSKNKR